MRRPPCESEFWPLPPHCSPWSPWLSAQPVFTGAEIFPPEEFAARRARVMERIGDGVAILQGTTERPGEQPLRQNNQFFYLTGVVEPRAIVVIDGRTKKTTLFLQPRTSGASSGCSARGCRPGAEAAKATGIDAVLPRDEFAAAVAGVRARRPRDLHAVPARGARRSLVAAIRRRCGGRPRRIRWDGRVSREERSSRS